MMYTTWPLKSVYYNATDHGVDMEVVKTTSSSTSKRGSWNFEARSYSNSYSSPVVVGQVMSENDTEWSVFWCSGSSSKTNPPNATSFSASKEIAEDNQNTTRANETIGYNSG